MLNNISITYGIVQKEARFTSTNNNFDERKDRWEEIKSNIKIDPTLDQKRVD
jgi:hypothetical protein